MATEQRTLIDAVFPQEESDDEVGDVYSHFGDGAVHNLMRERRGQQEVVVPMTGTMADYVAQLLQ